MKLIIEKAIFRYWTKASFERAVDINAYLCAPIYTINIGVVHFLYEANFKELMIINHPNIENIFARENKGKTSETRLLQIFVKVLQKLQNKLLNPVKFSFSNTGYSHFVASLLTELQFTLSRHHAFCANLSLSWFLLVCFSVMIWPSYNKLLQLKKIGMHTTLGLLMVTKRMMVVMKQKNFIQELCLQH